MEKTKVYVITKAKPFQPEQYIGVASTRIEAEIRLQRLYPFMRQKIKGSNTWLSDRDGTYILFIHEEGV